MDVEVPVDVHVNVAVPEAVFVGVTEYDFESDDVGVSEELHVF